MKLLNRNTIDNEHMLKQVIYFANNNINEDSKSLLVKMLESMRLINEQTQEHFFESFGS